MGTKNNTTDTVIRISTGHGKARANGDDLIAIMNVVSAFGPQNQGNVYMLRVSADIRAVIDNAGEPVSDKSLSAEFDIRNAKSGQWLGTWAVVDVPGNYTLWDATDISQNTPQRAPKSSQRAVQPAPVIPPVLSGLIINTRGYSLRELAQQSH